jgi:hypothetical protein
MKVNKDLFKNKQQILEYFRNKADVAIEDIKKINKRETRSKQMNDEIKRIALQKKIF